jgi:hypothetical protein
MTPVEVLRAAAEKARRLLYTAPPGPWQAPGSVVRARDSVTVATARKQSAPHIAAWHPGVTVHLADAWDALANRAASYSPDMDNWATSTDNCLLAAAREFIGSEPNDNTPIEGCPDCGQDTVTVLAGEETRCTNCGWRP